MTQTPTPQKQNNFAALDKKVADGIAADKAASQAALVTEPKKQQATAAPAAKS